MQGEMSQGRNVAQGEMSLREKCRREKSRREKCRREKCLSGRNVVQSTHLPKKVHFEKLKFLAFKMTRVGNIDQNQER